MHLCDICASTYQFQCKLAGTSCTSNQCQKWSSAACKKKVKSDRQTFLNIFWNITHKTQETMCTTTQENKVQITLFKTSFPEYFFAANFTFKGKTSFLEWGKFTIVGFTKLVFWGKVKEFQLMIPPFSLFLFRMLVTFRLFFAVSSE